MIVSYLYGWMKVWEIFVTDIASHLLDLSHGMDGF